MEGREHSSLHAIPSIIFFLISLRTDTLLPSGNDLIVYLYYMTGDYLRD